MKQPTTEPTIMIEELMYFIFKEQMGGELDPSHRFFPLYLDLQKLLEKITDERVAICNDEVKQ